MPELPDITIYVERLRHFVQGRRLQRLRIANPFLLRTAEPPIGTIDGLMVEEIGRIGKRISFAFEGGYFLILHLMIAGRLQWLNAGAKIPGRRGLAALDFENGSLLVTEASAKKRASLHLVHGREALESFERSGVDVFSVSHEEFAEALRAENHTLKRSLTDQRIVNGIGNAYSDEILHRAKISPFALTSKITDEEVERLLSASREVLVEWIDRLREQTGDGFPKKVTAFHEEMAVHGKYGQPCPVCGNPVQRIRYATRETNYCAHCQTAGKLLADRALSRLLRKDWPRNLEELEALYEKGGR